MRRGGGEGEEGKKEEEEGNVYKVGKAFDANEEKESGPYKLVTHW